jgi:hypothetical protein
MSSSGYEPRAVYEGDTVRYPDAEAVRDDLEAFLRHHIVPAVGARFPAPMEEFEFSLALPGGARVPARGRIISLREASALIRVDGWSEAEWSAIQAASRARTSAPAAAPRPQAPRSAADDARRPLRPSEHPTPPAGPEHAVAIASMRAPAPLPFSSRITAAGLAPVRPPVEAQEPPRKAPTDRNFVSAPDDDELRALHERRSKGNLFDALGCHFTDAPSRLRAAHRALVAEYRPGSPAHRRSPIYAELLVKLANHAWTVLSDKGSRRRYRREILAVDVDSAAQILASKSKLAMSRGDLVEARELLEAAADLHPDPEYVEDLRNLLSGNLPPPETEDTVELVRPEPRPHRQ